uniref:UDP-N-acetylmuramoyl-L-alanyl-D-glutamate--2, 6-diaminopimelate ligase n=1 Tax=Auraticoccus monumenti TaxID=675864 RepID=UPI000B833285
MAAETGGGQELRRPGSRPVQGVTLDSRQVRDGDLYAALPGQRTHGARFASDAVARGAVAVLTDAEGAALAGDALPPGTGLLVAEDPRSATARLAAALYDRPAERLTMLAVTGTNGKTTTAVLLEAALAAAGEVPATVGTLGFTVAGEQLVGRRTTVTTPESPDLQALLSLVAGRGATAVAMEVSSHALVLQRTDPVLFDVAGFTNLGQDHLDFHPDLDAYLDAKAMLFTPGRTRRAVVCLDSPAGAEIERRARAAGLDTVTTGLAPEADYHPEDLTPTRGGSTFTLVGPGGRWPVDLALPGTYNVSNAVLALAMLDRLGVDVARAATGLATATVPGRMQLLRLPGGSPTVVVDFAHTPQAVEATLGALRADLEAGGAPGASLLVVLGCGGDRDRAKRAPMGRAGARWADVVVVTDDNPRSEVPEAIRREVLDGAREGGRAREVLDGGDRRAALARALALAGPDDVVAVLGKGHESGQEVDGVVTPFDDAQVVTELAEQASAGHPTGGERRAATQHR